MPIEIRELVIKTRVEDSASSPKPISEASTGNATGAGLNAQQLENIIAQVIERVMDALKQQNER